jgi:hypothetical protein
MDMDRPRDAGESLLGTPVEIPATAAAHELFPSARQWMWAFLAAGILTRSVRYFLQFPLWDDECYTSVSVFQRGFRELLQPLGYHQVAPPLFLWLQKAVTLVFGFNELALRLVPFVGSLASVFLFYHLVSRLLRGPARLLCVACFAISYAGVRYAAEVKPYGTDLFVSLVLVVLFVEWLHRPARRRWLLALILWTPLAIGLSYPALFTVGGLSLLLLVALIRRKLRRVWLWWIAFNAAAALSLAPVFLFVIRPQMGAELGAMRGFWGNAFPPLDSLAAFAKWAVSTHTGMLLAHPAGYYHGGSLLTTIFVLIGIGVFVRRQQWTAPLLFLAPLSLNFAAAVLKRYPYGGHVRLSMYVAPMIYVLLGAGLAGLLAVNLRQGKTAAFRRNLHILLILLTLVAVGEIACDLLLPYKMKLDREARAFAQWFWSSANYEGRAVDLKDDLGREFSRGTWHELSWSAMYLANKYIYGRARPISLPRPNRVPPAQRILRCVLYRDGRMDFDQPAFDQWLTQMKKEHPYLGRDVYPFPRTDKYGRYMLTVDYVEIYKFALAP